MTGPAFCITTPIYYPNGEPHLGHVYTTLYRTYFDPQEFRRARTPYVLAPLLGFAEPLEIAALVDSVVIVARAGRTNRSAVANVVEQLKRVRANIIGVVLNGVRADMSSQYYYYSPRYYSHYTTEDRS